MAAVISVCVGGGGGGDGDGGDRLKHAARIYRRASERAPAQWLS